MSRSWRRRWFSRRSRVNFTHGTRAIIRPRIGFATNRQTIRLDVARAGLGIANLPEFLIEAALERGALVPVLPDRKPPPAERTAL